MFNDRALASVLCLSWYWEVFIILTRGRRVTGIHLVTPPKKAKNLGLFHVAWHSINTSMPKIGKKKSQGATTGRSYLSQMIPTVTSEWYHSPLLVLSTVLPILKGFPFGNLERLPERMVIWALVSNRTKKDYVFLLSQ